MVNSRFPSSFSKRNYWKPAVYFRGEKKSHNHSFKNLELSKENLGIEGLGLQKKAVLTRTPTFVGVSPKP